MTTDEPAVVMWAEALDVFDATDTRTCEQADACTEHRDCPFWVSCSMLLGAQR